MKPVYMISGGITKFAKAHPDKDFRLMVKEAYDYALRDLPRFSKDMISGAVGSYFSDHFTRQLKAASMVQDFLGLCPKPSKRVEGGGATGGLCFQSAWEAVASGRMECCVAFGFETMSRVNTWKGNEFIALASDTQMAMVSVKNHANALYNPYSQKAKRLTVKEVRESPMVATPLTMEDICTMSDGAAVCILASEDLAGKVCDRPVRISGVGSGSDAMRMADRPHGNVILLPHERESDYRNLKYPGVHSFRGGRMAAKLAYEMAHIQNPNDELSFVELHDAYTSSEIQTYEDLGLCKYGQGGRFVESGRPFMPGVDYGLELPEQGGLPVNPSGGLLACGHPVGATGLMQAVFAFWQLQRTMEKHLGNGTLQVKNPKRGLIHSHAGTGTYITVSILEAA